MISMKDNMLKTIHHQAPQWVPNGNESFVDINAPVVERPKQEGYDAFNVHWSFDEAAEGGTYPTLNAHPIKDITQWRDQITMPDRFRCRLERRRRTGQSGG